ncbi:MAG: hypothetical protein Q8P05_05680 [Candidatus Diapherotrites archaeon]|nr:hypothetical protein [Candidatus Diapherotrites archaeon]MDZ4256822.1 hypothetical protein [archaeon]
MDRENKSGETERGIVLLQPSVEKIIRWNPRTGVERRLFILAIGTAREGKPFYSHPDLGSVISNLKLSRGTPIGHVVVEIVPRKGGEKKIKVSEVKFRNPTFESALKRRVGDTPLRIYLTRATRRKAYDIVSGKRMKPRGMRTIWNRVMGQVKKPTSKGGPYWRRRARVIWKRTIPQRVSNLPKKLVRRGLPK